MSPPLVHWRITRDATNDEAYAILSQDPVWNCFALADLEPPLRDYSQFAIASQDESMERSLQKWHSFVQEALQSAVVAICDGLLFHGNMTDLLLMNAEPDVLFRYVAQVIESIQLLNPTIIYFYHADVTQALRAVCDARGSEWEAYQVNWKVRSPYGVQRSLQGLTGLVQLYRAYRALCDDFFGQLALPKLAIRNAGDWATYYQEILTFLQLPPVPPEVLQTG